MSTESGACASRHQKATQGRMVSCWLSLQGPGSESPDLLVPQKKVNTQPFVQHCQRAPGPGCLRVPSTDWRGQAQGLVLRYTGQLPGPGTGWHLGEAGF